MSQYTQAEAEQKKCPLVSTANDGSPCIGGGCMAWEWTQQAHYFIILSRRGGNEQLTPLTEEVQAHNEKHPEYLWPIDGWEPWSTNFHTRRDLEEGKVDLKTHTTWRAPIPEDQRLGECNAFSINRYVEMN